MASNKKAGPRLRSGFDRLRRHPSAAERADDPEQHDAPDEGDDDAPDVQAGRSDVAEHVEKPAADDRTDDADDEIAQYPTRAFTRHDGFCEEAGNDADDNPRKYVHESHPPNSAREVL